MSNPLVRKLESYVPLSEADRLCLIDVVGPGRMVAARTDIIHEGDDPRAVSVILDGWACRYRQFINGRRQIVSFLLPGDPCDPHVFLLDEMDHTIGAITPVLLGQISGPALQAMTARSPQLDLAFHREALATAAVQREWTISLGSRTGIERLAHLFCELHARLAAVGLAEAETCPMPITQNDLGDAMGQTSVHINRTLQELRGMGLITLRSRRLTIHDPIALARLAHFDSAYLHMTEQPGRAVARRA
ncbi:MULTISPECIES: Crp/Fnr family transcriptional regulator [unclassified Methylobacterium]|jgi:CRP-like cAMP-binding protein|uniref:Crp/Fnr family transcriptional regulator n=1 Tax=unclassified Methylobacterium TaxID=2615210 RepID=UPI001355F901|nr:Crp/Fnr family transcriptional regulator [Methylobacterium sp. 2A]MWV21293.1 Crp/Fnr family transcriptional regulator [Methylobacterium sp. 2A]